MFSPLLIKLSLVFLQELLMVVLRIATFNDVRCIAVDRWCHAGRYVVEVHASRRTITSAALDGRDCITRDLFLVVGSHDLTFFFF